ncbi:leucine-rich repeat domain-containing protein [Mucilaginibacter rubeus]|uniref:Leucine-rich repeat domain-containing protein n=1 Tax=Mucilaginibacter rubeus TaxID=2027860 RepID=A0AAE6JFS6_9SPHI|nr:MULTISPECIES: leucine-rich repeat domain-containing protein [Mucilaginibacter]QEM04583.1 leucine-rich repeat domain-containing protein [Mucilaginibacter rubeus]QEM17176.1 leucine-rich repeat domain-containing protein [Mucilaginibacter gossypii]QTE46319.1 leucine-rich repeat domain-containing protein [Mucilaginibacter rubeus]QTE52916.1 leucine-rich repeat domain-containing protein [Mucilaginibacter rubeus]QTE58002.1 leucine-rich repeat domain-containing protein [Mucilaginibacter rubeus]
MTDEQRLRDETTLPDSNYDAKFDAFGRLIGLQVYDSEYVSFEYSGNLLQFIGSFHFLTDLSISVENSDVIIDDLNHIDALTHLECLVIINGGYKDISPLSRMLRLRTLYLPGGLIENIEPVRNLVELTDLNLSTNKITDISALNEHTKLITVKLSCNAITNILALKSSLSLQQLIIDGNQITDLYPIAELSDLKVLHAARNRIADISPLKHLLKLTSLILSGNQLISLGPLEPLKKLELLEIGGVYCDDLLPIRDASNLKKLTASHIKYIDGTIIGRFGKLTGLSLTHCNISDVSFAKTLTDLYYIELDNNIIEDASPLFSLPNLYRISLRNNCITTPFPTDPHSPFALDLTGNPMCPKASNLNEYLIEAAQHYYNHGYFDKALAYHYIDANEKRALFIYFKKLATTDISENYYRLYYLMRCEQIIKKLNIDDQETETIKAQLIKIVRESNFFNKRELLISLKENGEAVNNYELFSEYITYLKSNPNPKPNPEIAYFLAKTFMRQDDLPQLLSIYKQLLDKGLPINFAVYHIIQKVLDSSGRRFQLYDYYLDLLINARDREIAHFDVFNYLNFIFGNYVHNIAPLRSKSKDWSDQPAENKIGWQIVFGILIVSFAFLFLNKGCH